MAKRKENKPAIVKAEAQLINPDADISGYDLIKSWESDIINEINNIAYNGSKEDEVRLKALKILLDKVVADERKGGVQFGAESPYEVIFAALKLKYNK